MDFVVIDVETANWRLSSICQIGIVGFKDGAVAETWCSLVNPEDMFFKDNVAVHGITRDTVLGAPKFPEVDAEVRSRFAGRVVASHTPFDRSSLRQAWDKYDLPHHECRWLDTARVVRRMWPDRYASRGYGLGNVTKDLGIEFRHHDAGEDARAAGEVLLRAMAESALSVEEWLPRSQESSTPRRAYPSPPKVGRDGNPDGPLVGESIVFTGALSMLRNEAADLAAKAGCNVLENVTLATTILVLGDQDMISTKGDGKSGKHRKAESLIAKGLPIVIIGETDFLELVSAGR